MRLSIEVDMTHSFQDTALNLKRKKEKKELSLLEKPMKTAI